jgi:hypothetical protein
MRLARLVLVGVAAVIGLASVALGIEGFRSFEFVQWALTKAGAFDQGQPLYVGADAHTWRSGYINAMTIFLAFGLATLVAAVGLFYQRTWARYLWFTLIGLAMLGSVTGLPHDVKAWLWLAACGLVFVFSWFVLRGSHARTQTAP